MKVKSAALIDSISIAFGTLLDEIDFCPENGARVPRNFTVVGTYVAPTTAISSCFLETGQEADSINNNTPSPGQFTAPFTGVPLGSNSVTCVGENAMGIQTAAPSHNITVKVVGVDCPGCDHGFGHLSGP
jgi:hypothetical protein